MRDIVLFVTVFGLLPLALWRPYVGILLWSWLGYMNPHKLSWGSAFYFPFAQVVGIVTLIGFVFDKEPKRVPWCGVLAVWIGFVVWMNVTTFFSLVPDLAWEEWDRTMKIQLMALLTLILMNGKDRIDKLVYVIVGSIGFFGVKGGIFSIATGGNFRVWGPTGTFIEGNNEIGLALVMILPLMWYVYQQREHKLLRWAILAAIGCTALAILTTHSRGAFLAIIAMAIVWWFRSRQKLWLGLIMLLAAPALWVSMPDHWHDRMATIQTYEEDGSAMGRINAWYFAVNLASDRPLVGGGFQTYMPDLFYRYAPDPEDFHDSHSIYFEILAEHGYVGLALFLILGTLSLIMAGQTRREAMRSAETAWLVDLCSMLQVSLIGYAVGGAFLGLAYFDLYYHLIALVVLSNVALKKHVRTYTPAVATYSENSQVNGGKRDSRVETGDTLGAS